jgi:retron-type reverse transcriptase
MVQLNTQPIVNFQDNDYWSKIAKYGKANYISNFNRIKKIDYKALNMERYQLNDKYTNRPIFKVLHNIAVKSTLDPKATFENISNIIHHPDVLNEALGRIRNNKGSLTPGFDNKTIDNINSSTINQISDKLKYKTYQFQPVKRIYIPKPGKTELRPLGIPNFEDRVVQSAIKIVLECIYEPNFNHLDMNYGFRPGLGCHHAVSKAQLIGSGARIAIEGDIKGAYDNVNFSTLLTIISKKIHDQDLIKLLKNLLESGIMEENVYRDNLLGVPQGGIVSPLLFNIYMNELDLYIKNTILPLIDQKNLDENRKVKPVNTNGHK